MSSTYTLSDKKIMQIADTAHQRLTNHCLPEDIIEFARMIERAVLANAEQAKDAERLDWLIRNNMVLTRKPVFHVSNGNLLDYEVAGNRASIDALIAASKANKGEGNE